MPTQKTKTVSKNKSTSSPSPSVSTQTSSPTSSHRKPILPLIIFLFLILLGLLTYKFLPFFIPVIVNKKPITRFSLYKRLDKAYGKQALDDMVNEAILQQAIKQSGITIDDNQVNQKISQLEDQFKSLGGLDTVLKQQGLTKDDLKKQIRTQLSVEQILKDKLNVSDEEIQKEYDKNKDTLYKDKQLDEVKDKIKTALRQDKLRTAFLDWFKEIKTKIKVVHLDKSTQ